jgi:hypothetical protein
VRAANDNENPNMEVSVREIKVSLPWQRDTLSVAAQLPGAQFHGHRMGESPQS